MEFLIRMEEKDDLKQDSKRMRRFQREINNTYDKNLDDILDKFIEKYDLEGSEIEAYSRKLIKDIKESNNI